MENTQSATITDEAKLSFDRFRAEVLKDYEIACISRETSLLGRKEVLSGKAKFGIFGDGKEIAQIAMAKFFQNGDFRSGYYRDQTFMLAAELANTEQIFAQLYADPNLDREPFSGGRQMNCHFATPFVDENGEWLDLADLKNISSDIAPTAGQMPRALGLAFASRSFRNIEQLHAFKSLSNNGEEVCFATIGDASTSEGHFWETINAAGVLQVPLAVFVWDDGYGISVPKKYQTTKASVSEALSGMEKKADTNGINIYKVKGWDYAGMCETFEEGIRLARENHTPVLFHVEEITQPQGHSTSGSHERYKSSERLDWEREWDGIRKMKEWIIANTLAEENELDEIADKAKLHVKESKASAWTNYLAPIKEQVTRAVDLINTMANGLPQHATALQKLTKELSANREPLRRDVIKSLHDALSFAGNAEVAFWTKDYLNDLQKENATLYNSK
ncbi:MAG TPA: thiamine pyrophosphate-dependent dehydrogenase E1 component subunit alpha, partial [Chitinophagaceae bacterium]|nr:thiamine pyrophosphate-dependent dehydrogenase E1 component subunit alpha [Chitinophagaceae bacterium]